MPAFKAKSAKPPHFQQSTPLGNTPRNTASLKRAALTASAWLWVGLMTACASPNAGSPTPLKPLSEQHAAQAISQVFKEFGLKPEPKRSVELKTGEHLEVDIKAEGFQFGVAYTSAAERQALGPALPELEPQISDALVLISGTGEDLGAKVLLLRDSDYAHDEFRGSARAHPVITAENKLKRDVRDFLVRARSEKWP